MKQQFVLTRAVVCNRHMFLRKAINYNY